MTESRPISSDTVQELPGAYANLSPGVGKTMMNSLTRTTRSGSRHLSLQDFNDPHGQWKVIRQGIQKTAKQYRINSIVEKPFEDKELFCRQAYRKPWSSTLRRLMGLAKANSHPNVNSKDRGVSGCLLTPPRSPENLVRIDRIVSKSSVREPPASQQAVLSQGHKPLPKTELHYASPINNNPKPKVVFRFQDSKKNTLFDGKNYTAGLFADNPVNIPFPPDCQSEEFCNAARKHLWPLKESSPFFSCRQGVFDPIKQLRRSGNDAHVSILDLEHLQQGHLSASAQGYDAEKIVQHLKSQSVLPESFYKGTGEWLIYGRAQAIRTFTLEELLEHISKYNKNLLLALARRKSRPGKCSSRHGRYPKGEDNKEKLGQAVGRFVAFLCLKKDHVLPTAAMISTSAMPKNSSKVSQRQFNTGVLAGYKALKDIYIPSTTASQAPTPPHPARPTQPSQKRKRSQVFSDDGDDEFMARRRKIRRTVGL
ncbi:hypothetical protein MMC20_002309 [Loxospora ochrophaea]|nr:hypothetical protein [Loxospora ochrophaea]